MFSMGVGVKVLACVRVGVRARWAVGVVTSLDVCAGFSSV